MFEKMKIGTRLTLLIGFMSVLMVAIGAIGFAGMVANHGGYTNAVEDSRFADELGLINHKLMDSRVHVLMARLNPAPDSLTKEAKTLEDNNVEIFRLLESVRSRRLEAAEITALQRFDAVVRSFVDSSLRPTAEAMRAGRGDEVERIAGEVTEKFYAPIKESRNALNEARVKTSQQDYMEASATYRFTRNLSAASILFGLVTAGLSGFMIIRRISSQVANINDAMLHVQNYGDLSRRANDSSSNELGQIAHAFDGLMEKFQNIIREVSVNAERVSQAATLVAEGANQAASSSQEQSGAANAMVGAVGRVSASIRDIAGRAEKTVDISNEASQLSKQGRQVVQNAAAEMQRIAVTVNESSQLIGLLGKRSADISGIVNVIREIADQTNLLALNAAIEAARAGEQGRGFAVVADEVRKLAERTSAATGEIRAMISTIQSETASAVANMEAGNEQVKEGSALAGEAGESLEKINQTAHHTMDMIGEIAKATQEQNTASEEIGRHVGRIAEMAQKNDEIVAGLSGSARSLEDLSLTLKKAVAHFRV